MNKAWSENWIKFNQIKYWYTTGSVGKMPTKIWRASLVLKRYYLISLPFNALTLKIWMMALKSLALLHKNNKQKNYKEKKGFHEGSNPVYSDQQVLHDDSPHFSIMSFIKKS